MLWYFELVSDSNELYLYKYSFESERLDGLIQYDKSTNEVKIIKPSEHDSEHLKAQQWTLEKFHTVIKKGLPQRVQIACG